MITDDDLADAAQEIATMARKNGSLVAVAQYILDRETDVHEPGCQWPIRIRNWSTGQRVETCGQSGVNTDATPRFCWKHNELMLLHIEDLVRANDHRRLPTGPFERFAEAIFDRVRANESTRTGVYEQYGDWVEREIERRLEEGEFSANFRARLDHYIEKRLSEKWGF